MTMQEHITYINAYVKRNGSVKIDFMPDAMPDHDETRYVWITSEKQMLDMPEYFAGGEKADRAIVFGTMARNGEGIGFPFTPVDVDAIYRAMKHDEEQHAQSSRYTPGTYFKMATDEERRVWKH